MLILILCAICFFGGLFMIIAPEKNINKDKLPNNTDFEAQKKKIRFSGACIMAVGIIVLLQHIL